MTVSKKTFWIFAAGLELISAWRRLGRVSTSNECRPLDWWKVQTSLTFQIRDSKSPLEKIFKTIRRLELSLMLKKSTSQLKLWKRFLIPFSNPLTDKGVVTQAKFLFWKNAQFLEVLTISLKQRTFSNWPDRKFSENTANLEVAAFTN